MLLESFDSYCPNCFSNKIEQISDDITINEESGLEQTLYECASCETQFNIDSENFVNYDTPPVESRL